MAAKAAVNGPLPNHPGPNEENLQSRANCDVTSSVQHNPGTSQNPGSSSRHQPPCYDRPVFNVHAPPPPPFLQYQWPMPFFYNPFAGFPSVGYGMVMPPFPPPPYIEAPAYILPNPHILPVDYRRMLQPQVHAPAAPSQNPNQAHRMRLPRSFPVTETMNSGVQTEPTQRLVIMGDNGYNEGCPLNSDSGQGTASDTPSSSCSSQRRASTEGEEDPLPHNNAKYAQVSWPCANIKVTHGFKILHPKGINAVQSTVSATQENQNEHKDNIGQEPPLIHYWRNGHCNMSTVSSPESGAPFCSSPQKEDEVVKERCISVPDILKSWGSGTPQRAALLNSLNASHKLSGDEQEKGNEMNLQEDPEIIPYQIALNNCQMNESVWSVESLAPYIPTKEWLLKNGMFEPEVFDMAVEMENVQMSIEIDNLVEGKERRRARRFSSSDSQVLHSSLIFRTPAEKLSPPKKPEMETETDVSEKKGPEQDKMMASTEKSQRKDLLASPLPLSKNLSPLTEEDFDENGSSEPKANQGPNQETITINDIFQKRTDTEVEEGAVDNEVRKEELYVPVADQMMPELSPSKGHLVDCGVQCSEFKCPCGEVKDCMEQNKRHPSKCPDMKKANTQKHLKRNGFWRNKAQDKNGSQQEVYCGQAGKLVKSKGGNGKNLRS